MPLQCVFMINKAKSPSIRGYRENKDFIRNLHLSLFFSF
jgi:hypothetical protein